MTEDKLLRMNKNRERVRELTEVYEFNKGLLFTKHGKESVISASVIFDDESRMLEEIRASIIKEIKRLNYEFEKM